MRALNRIDLISGYIFLLCMLLCFSSAPAFAKEYSFEWDANHPNDNVIAYRIYWSTTPETYNTTDSEEIPVDSLTDANNPQWTIDIQDPLPGEFYHFVCTAWDGEFESDYSFEISAAAPSITTPPTVTNITDNSAVVSWSTDELADSQVHYGDNSATWGNYDLEQNDGNLVIDHTVNLSSLSPDTDYFFRVGSTNQAGEGPVISSEVTFTTDPGPDNTSPVITSQPSVINIADTSATIVWGTDEPSDSVVEYGLTTGYGSTETDGTNVTSHSITLNGLSPETTYQFRVGSQDIVGNPYTYSGNSSFVTTEIPDTTPPVITTPTVTNITDTSAIVSWQTDEPATSIVEYGQTISYARSKTLSNYVTSHVVTLTLLEGETLYHYRVGSTDESNNGPRYSGDYTFTTEPTPDTTAPVITSSPTVTGITDTTATITWYTDEPSNSQVRYGLLSDDWADFPESTNKAEMVTQHVVTLTGLEFNRDYYYMVGSTDAEGNGPNPGNPGDNNPTNTALTFKTATDQTAPYITNVTETSVTDSSVTIEWDTDESANSLVKYDDVTGSWGSYNMSKSSPTMGTHHQITLTGLTPSTTYYYRVGSTDQEGNGPDPGVPADNNPSNAEFTFITENDQTDPSISVPPSVTGVTNTTAVISWSTNEPANSLVQYQQGTGTLSWGAYQSSQNDATMVMNHSVTLTNLQADKPYIFRVGSIDIEGNGPVVSSQGSFNTEPDPDTTAPVITAPTVISTTYTTATIAWQTDEPANSEVRYGTATNTWSGYGYIATSAVMTTDHQVTLTNLENGRRYYYRVGSTDANGNGPDTDINDNNPSNNESNFITDTAPDEEAPLIISDPPVEVVAIYDDSAVIEWETDEPSNSTIRYSVEPGTWQSHYWTASNVSMELDHSFVLGGLQPGTTYYFSVGSVDAFGNGPDWNTNATNPSASYNFQTTNTGPDTTAPNVIPGSLEVATVTNKLALIEWRTEEPSNSIVAWSLNENFTWDDPQFKEEDAVLTTQHSVTIPVQPDTDYYFRVGSTDIHGNGPNTNFPDNQNPTVEAQYFKSLDGDDETAPQISNLKTTTLSDTTIRVEWDTDEPGNSQVRYDTQSRQWNEYPNEENDPAFTMSHNVVLTGLDADQRYYIRVSSDDVTGNNYASSPNDKNASIELNETTDLADPPSILVYPDPDYPKLDAVENTIDIWFDEINLKNVEVEANYTFTPSLEFAISGESIEFISSVGNRSRYRFSMDPAADLQGTILVMTLTNDVTDADNNPVTPDTVLINDNDADDLPDDWEESVVESDQDDDILDIFDIDPDDDLDEDGYSNAEEFINGKDPLNSEDFPSPPQILEALPYDDAGIKDEMRVPNNSSFAILFQDADGIDLTNPMSVIFSIDDGDDTYTVDMGASFQDVIRIIKLDDTEDDTAVTQAWVVYDRSLDENISAMEEGRLWPYNRDINITVTVSKIQGENLDIIEEDYSFKVELSSEHQDAIDNPVSATVLDVDEPPYNAGFRLEEGDLTGATLYYNTNDTTPTVRSNDDLPVFSVTNAVAIGDSINLQPPNVFSTPVRLVVPTPGRSNASGVSIYVYNGDEWTLGCDTNGDSDIIGWMVPGSRVVNGSTIELKVWHFSGIQAAVVSQPVDPDNVDENGEDPVDPEVGTCFIDLVMK